VRGAEARHILQKRLLCEKIPVKETYISIKKTCKQADKCAKKPAKETYSGARGNEARHIRQRIPLFIRKKTCKRDLYGCIKETCKRDL